MLKLANLFTALIATAAMIGITAGVADANPAPYSGSVNMIGAPHVAKYWSTDCSLVVGYHNNQSIYGGNGRTQAAGTFVCDGSRYHNLSGRVSTWAVNQSGNWQQMTASSWVGYYNTTIGLGYQTLTSPAWCNYAGSDIPTTTTWTTELDVWIDGHEYPYFNTQGSYSPNHC
jgi:hypothetical protein